MHDLLRVIVGAAVHDAHHLTAVVIRMLLLEVDQVVIAEELATLPTPLSGLSLLTPGGLMVVVVGEAARSAGVHGRGDRVSD